MEIWQKQSIRRNLTELLENIFCHTVFIAKLQSDEIISDEDVAKLGAKSDRYDKTKYLLDILQSRVNGYSALLKSLRKTKQTGALEILLHDLPPSLIANTEVDLNGSLLFLGNLLDQAQIQSVLKTTNVFERTDFILNILEHKMVKLVNNIIPSRVPYYVPRILSKRLRLNKNIFVQSCADIFVIHGIDRPTLTKLAYGNKTACSSDQREEVTVRFIKLENMDHWMDIRDLVDAPIHLIYYNDEHIFVLQETSGGSKILSHFLEKQNIDDDSVISEDNLLNEMNSQTATCICDLPGMGKTLLLASLAQHVTKNAKSLPVFIRLQHFIHTLKSGNIDGNKRNLFRYITYSNLDAAILEKVVESYKLRLEIFCDEFDEINHHDISNAKHFLRYIATQPNIGICVTSRPHMRHELENALGVIAYDILPFSEKNQISFLMEYWASTNQFGITSNLSEFAQVCLKKFKRNVSPSEKDLAGIPLQCRLIAEVYLKAAVKYSGTLTVNVFDGGKTMFDMYKKFIEIKFATRDYFNENTGVSTLRRPFTSSPSNKTSNSTRRNYHQDLAMQIVFPEFRKKSVQDGITNDSSTIKEMMSCGLLEEEYNGREYSLQFIHKTFAEYLAAEYVAVHLTNELQNYSYGKNERSLYSWFTNPETEFDLFLKFVFQNIFKIHHIERNDDLKRRHLCVFTHSTVMYFLDHQIKVVIPNLDRKMTRYMTKYLSKSVICEIFESCGYHNFGNMYDFIETICQSSIKKYKSVLTKKYFCGLLSVFCEHSSRELVDKCVTFLNNLFSVTLDNIFLNYAPKNNYCTPLEYACKRRSYDLLEYFLNKNCSPEGKLLLHICVENSVNLTLNTIQTKLIPMVILLLNQSPGLINELDSFGRTSLFASRSSFHLIKTLIQKGADLEQRDKHGNTVAHKVSDWMSPNDFHALTLFLLDGHGSRQILKTKNLIGNTPLHCALQSIKLLKPETVKLVLVTDVVNVNEKNKNEENLLISAVKGGQTVEMLKVLIELGADYAVRRRDIGWNLLHVAADTGNFEIFYYLLTFGIDDQQPDKYGRIPFQIINEYDVNNCNFIDTIVDI